MILSLIIRSFEYYLDSTYPSPPTLTGCVHLSRSLPVAPSSQLEMLETTKAFFYGTLMHPEILKRVVGNEGTHLEICPAVLMASDSDP